MKHDEKKAVPLDTLYDVLKVLEPFLIRLKPQEDEVELLGKFISSFIPIDYMVLIGLNERGKCREFSEWMDDDVEIINYTIQSPSLSRIVHADGIVKEENLRKTIEEIEHELDASVNSISIPVTYSGKLVGIAFFNVKSKAEAPDERQLKVLDTVMAMIGVSFANRNYVEKQQLQGFVFNSMMDNMNACLYITDVDTDEILFMNRNMKKAFGLENPEGEVCWKVLQKGMDGRCEFCPVDRLLASGDETPFHVWEELNTVTNRNYENYDSLIRWIDGSTVHFQHSVDVTESKLLSRNANMDELSNMLNRRAGKEALKRTLDEARVDNVYVAVCLYDVNMLKEINDLYGHAEGDKMLSVISETVVGNTGGKSYPFRLSGDEFVVVFYDVRRSDAKSKMDEVLDQLEVQRKRLGIPYELSFCYGVIEIDPAQKTDISDILIQADEKMYEQKRQFHISQARNMLKTQHQLERPPHDEGFTYDKNLLYNALVRSTDDYIYVCNMKTNTFRYTKAMVEEFDLPGEIIENAAAIWEEKVHEHDRGAFLESNQDVADGRTNSHCVEYRAKNRKGEWVWLRCRGYLERDANGEPSLFAGIITNLGKKNRIDHMTGIFNKLEFEEEVKRAIEAKVGMGMMVLGMDDFKHVNDLYNRPFGDEVIRITAQKIQAMLPGNAALYRLDGDEFGIIAKGATEDDMRRIYAAIHNTFRHQQEYNENRYYCTLSAGCSIYPKDAETYVDILKCADYSLEYSKNVGKNRITFFSKDILKHKERSLELIELLREKIEDDDYSEFELFYQPQVDAMSGAIMGAEALARWNSKKYGWVSPAEFIPLLEQSGLIIPLGKWIFKTAISKCVEWVKFNDEFVMSINLSYVQLTEPGFIPFMKSAIDENGLSTENVVVELTESYMAKGTNSVKEIFDRIRELGFKIAMDDFGTGYSSLDILKNSPADIVKIDKTFIKDIMTSNFDATFIKFIVELCHDVDISVCLEGVERLEEYNIVKTMNLDMIQGFLFGRPEPPEEFERKFLNTDIRGRHSTSP